MSTPFSNFLFFFFQLCFSPKAYYNDIQYPLEANTMKILVIEDEKMLAESIKSLLERKGFQVETVYDGETGAQFAELGIITSRIRRS